MLTVRSFEFMILRNVESLISAASDCHASVPLAMRGMGSPDGAGRPASEAGLFGFALTKPAEWRMNRVTNAGKDRIFRLNPV
jgi:hypothetical protein